VKEALITRLKDVCVKLGIDPASIALEYPEDAGNGDFSTNLAMANAKAMKASPKQLADKITAEFSKPSPDFIQLIEVAGPGFINFKLKDKSVAEAALSVGDSAATKPDESSKPVKQVMVEYTDPNPFKVFHIGHLMSNAIGESLSRLIEHAGTRVIRACYQGDVGLHVAKTIWAIQREAASKNIDVDDIPGSVTEKVKWLGEMYVAGSKFDDDVAAQKEIKEINQKIFGKTDPEINKVYDLGRAWSLEYFGSIYKRLGTKFDSFFFESEVDELGMKTVEEFLKKGVFAKSEGAIVFKGEEHGLHTRVFVTSQGLPTYETKELGLTAEKFKLYPDLDQSIVITANEQTDYFKVLLKVLSLTHPNIAARIKHLSHGLMRFQSGKMSSRKGNIISAEGLIDEIRALVMEKLASRELPANEKDEIADQVAIGAIKYTILRQSIGGDVIFDSAKSISFEGDSGPYLQYSAVRAQSVLRKAAEEGPAKVSIENSVKVSKMALPEKVGTLERLLIRFPDIAARAAAEYAPQHVAGYLIQLAGEFNAFYAGNPIVSVSEPLSPYRIALTHSFLGVMTGGLDLLGIKVPRKM